ncbi:MAG: hypothetical protein JRJ41_08555 [Deltaproteobacteria bacterium]|nr:hypothetical protein [Deltaproteobacteria bacterium]
MMQNLSKRSNRITDVLRSLKHRKMSGQWSFLFVKENGKIISIDRFKELVMTLAVVMTIMFVTITVVYVLYKGVKEKNENLEKAMKASEQKIVALQDEKDVLMVRLVLAESKIKNQHPDVKKDLNDQTTGTLSNESIPVKIKTNSEKKTFELVENHSATKQNAVLSGSRDTTQKIGKVEMLTFVDIEDMDVFHDANKNILRVKFILRKTEPTIKNVSGRAFVVLKSDNDEKDPLVLPSVSLTSGKPSQVKRGQYFSIAHFKWMKFEKRYQPATESFRRVTAFIFTTKGELLLEKDFAI